MGGYSVFLIAALIVVSGVIAYIGDVIGRGLGRRRVTLFNLRPRYTAMAISVVAGMLIAAFTLTSAMLVSRNVRDAFLHVDAMRKENRKLERDARELEAHAERVQQHLEEVSTSLGEKTSELTTSHQELRRVSQELKTFTGRLQAVQGKLDEKTRELDDKTKRLAQVENELADITHQLANAKRIVAETYRRVLSLQTERDELETQRDQLQAQIQDLSRWISRWVSHAEETFREIRTQPVIFGANEQILTVVIQGARPASEVRKDLEDTVNLVNEVAVNAGAGKGADGRAIAIFRLVLEQETGRIDYYSEDQVLEAVASAIADAPGSVIVRAASLGNVVRGETVLVDFELFHNKLVLRQGEKLGQVSVDSSRDQASLLLDLVAFLRSKVSVRAREAGVMARPISGPAQRGEALFAGPGEVVGEIRVPELLEVIRDIKEHQGMVLVTARARADTWTAGPLEVKLEVEGRA